MASGRVEPNPVSDTGVLRSTDDVIVEHLARGVGRYLLAEMLVECVVGKFQTFLGSVRPQIAVHAAMYRLAVLVEAGAPGVVPQTAPIALLLEADDVGDRRPLALRPPEWPQLP